MGSLSAFELSFLSNYFPAAKPLAQEADSDYRRELSATPRD